MPLHRKIALLRLLTRFAGGVMLLAIPAVFMPTTWMARIHEHLSLGPFPATPLVDYLTRSVAAVYAIHGGLLMLLSRDIVRLSPVIVYLGCTNIAFGCVVTGIGLHANMPLYWILAEGPPVAAFGAILLLLARGLDSPAPTAAVVG